jgi:UDP-N-acetylglucosamine 2-epimerase (non-hydrolysing)
MKVLCIFGTRPEAIKMAPVIAELRKHPERIDTRVCVTGQHREMLDQALAAFDIHPDLDLEVMTENQSLSALTSKLLSAIDPVMDGEKPDWVLVQGDTTTTMAASLAAYYHRIRVGHVEAGLRTGNKFHPFPEEINRRIADTITDLHFAPTERARQNLLREGTPANSVLVTGNTVIDALLSISEHPIPQAASDLLQRLHIPQDGESDGKRLILVTAHRRENFGGPLENICDALSEIAANHDNVQVLFLVHLNPNVQQTVRSRLSDTPNIHLMPPLDYPSMAHLLKRSYLVLTDSGGLQEEAPAFGVPVLVMRETTERPEAVEAGTAKVVGTEVRSIADSAARLLDDADEYGKMSHAANPFGDGHASERIVRALLDFDS